MGDQISLILNNIYSTITILDTLCQFQFRSLPRQKLPRNSTYIANSREIGHYCDTLINIIDCIQKCAKVQIRMVYMVKTTRCRSDRT